MSVASVLRKYADTNFVSRDAFLNAANIDGAFFEQITEHQVIPDAIYRIWRHAAIWSPIGGHVGGGNGGREPDSEWFNPAALWCAYSTIHG